MCSTMGYGLEIAKITMPDTLKAAGSELALNGAGIRTKFMLKLYVGGLYLEQKSSDANSVINAEEPMAVRLHIISSLITSEKMEDATREGFENSLGGNIEPLKGEIEAFINIFKEQINENDIFDFIYIPGTGVEVYKNGAKASVVEGIDFKKALFGIWLCDKPAQKSLKEEMLGM
ncbi:MAG TPA: chalcone isomerase [Deltaproteobacteria bacterium]|nr:chalcone isomerase [Deltaproteobacteria bacterium]